MKAIDFRNATFEGLRDSLDAKRAAVYAAWQVYGPGTTRQVAGEAGIDLLTFRPRTTELLQMGLLTVADCEMGREGVYRVSTAEVWRELREGMLTRQLQLI